MLKRPKPNKEAVAQLLDLEEVDHVMDEIRHILDRSKPDFISDLKTHWESFYGKVQFYGVFKKVLRPPTAQDKAHRKPKHLPSEKTSLQSSSDHS
ncbi:hypothetical protein MHYP_G00362800 [Metynnis hypsauchen]